MSLITFKSGVIVSQQAIIACAVVNAANQLGLPDMVVTSGRDGTHMEGSLHFRDRALDLRTRHLTHEQKTMLLVAVKTRLGKDYDCILENEGKANEHMHIENDPK